jgi:uncharacterized protein involved in type VI secretion and phage assembly
MNLDALHRLLTPADRSARFYGVVIGIVTNNKDPDDSHRVKVRFPWLDADNESHWARVASPMAGNDRGLYFLPEVDDEVLVAFEHGCVEFPYVVGSLWNGKDKAPESNSDGMNRHRTIKSRSGHVIRLNDESGSETIEIIDKSANNRIVISTSDNTITIQAQSDVLIQSSSGKLKLNAVGIEMSSTAGVKIDAAANIDITASGMVNVKGSMVKLN